MELSLGLFLGSLVFFIVFLFMSFYSYKNRFNVSYSIRNMFPFELNYPSVFSKNIFGNICFILAGIAGMFGFYFSGKDSTNGFQIALMIVGMVQFAAFVSVLFVSTSNLMLHLVSFTLLFATTFATSALEFTSAFNYVKDASKPLFVVVLVASALVMLLILGLILNPKLSLKIKPVVKTDENGNEYNERPKFIVFALTEWIMFFVIYANAILQFLLKLQISQL